jgi:phage-related protein
MPEVFNWSPRVGASGDVQPDVLTSQYNNGYSQRLSVGINNLVGTYAVSFTGGEAYIKAIRDFFKRHKGANHFLWTPPLEDQGAYITTGGWQLQSHGKKKYTISTTFEQVFAP